MDGNEDDVIQKYKNIFINYKLNYIFLYIFLQINNSILNDDQYKVGNEEYDFNKTRINNKQFELFISQFENKEEESNKVKEIDLSGNKLTSISKSMLIFKYLENLYMTNNNINTIQSFICELKYLKQLWLNGNQIKEIPFEISLLNNLEYLSLSSNKLKIIPSFIGDMKSIVCFHLNGNKELKRVSFNLIKKKGIQINLRKCNSLPIDIQKDYYNENDWDNKGLTKYLNDEKERILNIQLTICKVLSFNPNNNIESYKFNPLWFNKDCIRYIMKRYGEMEVNLEQNKLLNKN